MNYSAANYNKSVKAAEEAYRVIRTNIRFCEVGKKIRTITITSCMPGEGKSTTARNLAESMAKSGMKVILLDADLRKPIRLRNTKKRAAGTITAAGPGDGLSNLIAGGTSLRNAIVSSEVENLHIINSGPLPPNPVELLSSGSFSELLAELKNIYDMVIIDTPPVGLVIDGAVIASQTDGTILVVKYNKVDYPHIIRVKEQLEKVNAKILGVVLNGIKKREYKNYYGY